MKIKLWSILVYLCLFTLPDFYSPIYTQKRIASQTRIIAKIKIENDKKRKELYLRNLIVYAAASQEGKSWYVWGGSSPKTGFDCSGLAMWSFNYAGFHINRDDILNNMVAPTEFKTGDIILFSEPYAKKITHVGIYAGNNMFIHAMRPGTTVRQDMLNDFWKSRIVGKTRVVVI